MIMIIILTHTSTYIYIYIYIERERERCIMYTHIDLSIYRSIYLSIDLYVYMSIYLSSIHTKLSVWNPEALNSALWASENWPGPRSEMMIIMIVLIIIVIVILLTWTMKYIILAIMTQRWAWSNSAARPEPSLVFEWWIPPGKGETANFSTWEFPTTFIKLKLHYYLNCSCIPTCMITNCDLTIALINPIPTATVRYWRALRFELIATTRIKALYCNNQHWGNATENWPRISSAALPILPINWLFGIVCVACGIPFGDHPLTSEWYGTISMAPAQGWHAQIDKCKRCVIACVAGRSLSFGSLLCEEFTRLARDQAGSS